MSELLAQLLVAADADRFHGRCRDACHLVRAFHRLGGSRCVSARHDVANLGRGRPRSHHRTDRVLPSPSSSASDRSRRAGARDRLEAASAYEVRRMRGVRLSRAVRLRAVPGLPHAAQNLCGNCSHALEPTWTVCPYCATPSGPWSRGALRRPQPRPEQRVREAPVRRMRSRALNRFHTMRSRRNAGFASQTDIAYVRFLCSSERAHVLDRAQRQSRYSTPR